MENLFISQQHWSHATYRVDHIVHCFYIIRSSWHLIPACPQPECVPLPHCTNWQICPSQFGSIPPFKAPSRDNEINQKGRQRRQLSTVETVLCYRVKLEGCWCDVMWYVMMMWCDVMWIAASPPNWPTVQWTADNLFICSAAITPTYRQISCTAASPARSSPTSG